MRARLVFTIALVLSLSRALRHAPPHCAAADSGPRAADRRPPRGLQPLRIPPTRHARAPLVRGAGRDRRSAAGVGRRAPPGPPSSWTATATAAPTGSPSWPTSVPPRRTATSSTGARPRAPLAPRAPRRGVDQGGRRLAGEDLRRRHVPERPSGHHAAPVQRSQRVPPLRGTGHRERPGRLPGLPRLAQRVRHLRQEDVRDGAAVRGSGRLRELPPHGRLGRGHPEGGREPGHGRLRLLGRQEGRAGLRRRGALDHHPVRRPDPRLVRPRLQGLEDRRRNRRSERHAVDAGREPDGGRDAGDLGAARQPRRRSGHAPGGGGDGGRSRHHRRSLELPGDLRPADSLRRRQPRHGDPLPQDGSHLADPGREQPGPGAAAARQGGLLCLRGPVVRPEGRRSDPRGAEGLSEAEVERRTLLAAHPPEDGSVAQRSAS